MFKLLVRPAIASDEWWGGYVSRVLQANGYLSKNVIGLRTLEALVSEMAPADVVQRHVAGTLSDHHVAPFSEYGLPAWAVQTAGGAIRYCPCCVRESAYVRMRWRLWPVTVCDVHRVSLTRSCKQCGRQVFCWSAPGWQCRCGQDLTAAECEQPPPADEMRLQASLLRALPDVPVVDGADAHGVGQQFALYLFLTAALKRLVAKSLLGNQAAPKQTEQQFVDGLGLQAERSLVCVETLWRRLPSQCHALVALKFVWELYLQERQHPTILSTLPLVAWIEQINALGPDSNGAARRRWTEKWRQQASLKRAARRRQHAERPPAAEGDEIQDLEWLLREHDRLSRPVPILSHPGDSGGLSVGGLSFGGPGQLTLWGPT